MARRCGLLFLPAKLHPIDKTAGAAGAAPKAAIQFASWRMLAYSLPAMRMNPILKNKQGGMGRGPMFAHGPCPLSRKQNAPSAQEFCRAIPNQRIKRRK